MNEELVMTEEKAKEALFKINFEYMSHPPKERIKLYDKYKEDREEVKRALARSKFNKLQETKVK